jgi:L-ribulose-5-phosphate 3-epimerase
MILANKIGVKQGRLSPPVDGRVQEFPLDWEKEFHDAKTLGLCGIEWIITKRCFLDNPIIANPLLQEIYPITSVCLDVLIDSRIASEEFLNQTLVVACQAGLRRVTIPILDDSDLNDDEKRKAFCGVMKNIGERFSDIEFSFEAELDMYKLEEIVSLDDNFKVTYDTGNMTFCGFDHDKYIKFFGDRINNVHLKDRTIDSGSVAPFEGDTDFLSIFKALKDINYSEGFVLETARADISEVETISKHKKLFEELDCLI